MGAGAELASDIAEVGSSAGHSRREESMGIIITISNITIIGVADIITAVGVVMVVDTTDIRLHGVG